MRKQQKNFIPDDVGTKDKLKNSPRKSEVGYAMSDPARAP